MQSGFYITSKLSKFKVIYLLLMACSFQKIFEDLQVFPYGQFWPMNNFFEAIFLTLQSFFGKSLCRNKNIDGQSLPPYASCDSCCCTVMYSVYCINVNCFYPHSRDL